MREKLINVIKNNLKLLEVTVEQSQEEIFWLDKQGRILYANISACISLGYSEDEIRQLTLFDIDADLSKKKWNAFLEVIRDKEKIRYESIYKKKKGEKIFVEVSMNYYKIVDKEFITIFSHNIEKRRKIELALKESEEKFRMITENSTDTILHINADEKILYASPAAERLFEQTTNQIEGRQISRFFSSDKKEELSDKIKLAHQGQEITNLEVQILSSTDNDRVAEMDIIPLQGNGSVIHQVILRDITPRKSAERQLESALLKNERALLETHLLNESLEREIAERRKIEKDLVAARGEAVAASKAKSEFLANMSHEIRTPLNAVLGFAEILKERLKGSEFMEFVEGINTGGRSLLSLINDILDLSKIEAGKMEVQLEPIDPLVLLNEVNQIFGTKIQGKGLDLVLEKPDNLPRIILIDHTRVRQILFNLIGNAIKFTSKGAISMALKIEGIVKKENRITLIFEVRDTGIGIPRKQQRLIFEPFTQKEGQSTRRYGGTGLGLTITKRLVEMMHGEISLDSRTGKGSCFTVKLHNVLIPVHDELPADAVKNNLDDISFMGSRVLLVEDNLANRIVFREFLLKYDLEIHEAENGQQALDMIDNINPDIIFMDLRMPVMDGYIACQHIREDPRYRVIPIIAFSASIMIIKEDNELSNFNDSLLKPISKRAVLEKLVKYLPFKGSKTDIEDKEQTRKPTPLQLIGDVNLNEVKDIFGLNKSYNETIVKKQQDLEEFIDLDEAQKLAGSLIELANNYQIRAFEQIGNDLAQAAKSFRMSEIENIVKALPALERKINEAVK